MSNENKQNEIKTEVKTEVKNEVKKEVKDEKEKYLRPYWYPSFTGEQHPELPQLQHNPMRPSFSTKMIQNGINFVFLGIFVFIIKMFYALICVIVSSTTIPESSISFCSLLILCTLLAMAVTVFYAKKPRPVYLVDFATTLSEEKYKITNAEYEEIINSDVRFNKESLDFQIRLLRRTGLGEETYLPPALHRKPITSTMADGREEIQYVMKLACDDLFKQTQIDPTKDIDFVICNCSLFNPTPSIAALLMNMYKCKQTCKNYNLAGMGCSAGLISIDLAKDILQTYKNVNVLVFSTENLTKNYYHGKVKGMLMSNTLFRMGGAAILLSNKRSLKKKSMFEIVSTQRIVHAKYDESYKAVFQYEDEEGIVGVKIGRELFGCVTKALIQNLNLLMPKVISYKDMIRFIVFFIKQKMGKIDKKETFIPNFRETFQGYCIHAGGRAIVDGIQDKLGLTDEDCYPSRATLYRFGNTSSSSVWYEMKFIERIQSLKKGDKVWQIAFGSGLKCNSVVWRKLH